MDWWLGISHESEPKRSWSGVYLFFIIRGTTVGQGKDTVHLGFRFNFEFQKQELDTDA